jgi:hypothetical protein
MQMKTSFKLLKTWSVHGRAFIAHENSCDRSWQPLLSASSIPLVEGYNHLRIARWTSISLTQGQLHSQDAPFVQSMSDSTEHLYTKNAESSAELQSEQLLLLLSIQSIAVQQDLLACGDSRRWMMLSLLQLLETSTNVYWPFLFSRKEFKTRYELNQ